MGYVEMIETIRRISAIPIPEGAILMFAMTLRGLTYDNLIVNAHGLDAKGREIEGEWKITRIPTSDDLADYTNGIHRLFRGIDPR